MGQPCLDECKPRFWLPWLVDAAADTSQAHRCRIPCNEAAFSATGYLRQLYTVGLCICMAPWVIIHDAALQEAGTRSFTNTMPSPCRSDVSRDAATFFKSASIGQSTDIHIKQYEWVWSFWGISSGQWRYLDCFCNTLCHHLSLAYGTMKNIFMWR